MPDVNIFVSVGGTATVAQETFVRAVEDRLRSEGMTPHTVGRNTFSADAPLTAVTRLMDTCSGAVVIALERTFFPSGTERRGGIQQAALSDVKLPTPWNQIEAAMAYSRGLPLLVIVESGLNSEGLLERGYDWYVQQVQPQTAALNSNEFNGVLASWKNKLAMTGQNVRPSRAMIELTVAELLGSLKPGQLWSCLAGLAALVAGAFAAGAKLFGAH